MLLHLAYRNLVHDRTRLVVTLVGVAVAVILVGVQSGLYQGFSRLITAPIAMARTDLWVVPAGATIFEDAGLLPPRSRERALAVPGVAAVSPVLVRFADWRKPAGGRHTVSLIGIEAATGPLQPWSMVLGAPADLAWPDGVAVDRSYLRELGIDGIGDTAEIGEHEVRVIGLTAGVRSFTTVPYVFASLDTVRRELRLPSDTASFLLVRTEPGDPGALADGLARRLPGTEVLTGEAFAERTRAYWLGSTGAGAALAAGTLLSLIVGAAIVAQTLYASTIDHLAEFATLRALGARRRYLLRVVLAQAGLAAVAGYAIGIAVVLALARWAAGGAAPLVITRETALVIFAAVVLMCIVAAAAPMRTLLRLDPAAVLRR